MLSSLSQSIGVPPSLRASDDLTALSRLASNEALPRELAARVEIQISVAKYTSLVSESATCYLGVSLEQAFVHELDHIKERFCVHWNPDIEVVLLDAKLHLIATLLVSHGKQLGSVSDGSRRPVPDPQLMVTLSDGLSCAVQLIQLVCVSGVPAHLPNPLLRYATPLDKLYMYGLPKLYFRGLLFAAFYLLRYHVSRDSAFVTDWKLARKHVTIACDYLRSQSSRPTDEAGRAAAVIETLNDFAVSLSHNSMSSVGIQERLGASIFYDALTRANELRARPVHLLNDQERPQQAMTMKTIQSDSADLSSMPDTQPGETVEEDATVNEDYLTNLPEDWLDHLDLDMMELSGELFAGASIFS